MNSKEKLKLSAGVKLSMQFRPNIAFFQHKMQNAL